MTQAQIISELKTIIAHSDETKQRATGLLRKLERVSTHSTARKGSKEWETKLIAGRRKAIIKQ